MATTKLKVDPSDMDRMFLRITISFPYEKNFAYHRIACPEDIEYLIGMLRKEVLQDLASIAKEKLNEVESRLIKNLKGGTYYD